MTSGGAPGDLNPPTRLLLGSGPSNPEPRVLRVMATPLIGQFDPAFTQVMDEVMALSRHAFRTANHAAFPVSGTSRAGLEAALASLIEDGDRVVVAVHGRFGDLLRDIAARYGADVVPVDGEWGQILEPDAIIARLRERRTRLVAVVHADTSTGIVQPLEAIARACREEDALLLVDGVLSLGGCELHVDDWALDVCVGGLQKCLGGPSGMAPLTYNARAAAVLAGRRTPPRTNYLDLVQIERYWSPERLNHHTAPTSMVYALREALRIVQEEGLAARWARHRRMGTALVAGLEAMGLHVFGDRRYKTPMITLVPVPDGVSEPGVRARLLEEYGIEIMAAFGPLHGRVWRLGLMGYNARPDNVLLLLGALEAVLAAEGYHAPPRAGVEAARGALAADCT
jgi:(S)-ureidoglycine-glyoxylate aminotransferase